jgi:hypothetical protein
MCQIVGTCFVEDPFAKQKAVLWHARWFVEVLRPDGTYSELAEYLKQQNLSVSPQRLKELLTRSLRFLEEEGGGPRREAAWRRVLALLPEEARTSPQVATAVL